MIPFGATQVTSTPATPPAEPLDLSEFDSGPPPTELPLLFIHHSVGGQLLAPPGPAAGGEDCIYDAYPSGGDLRAKLTAEGYEVHEASYHSAIGDKTDLYDWPEKFATHMDAILRLDHQDRSYEGDKRNRIVMFKSCYPNTWLVGEGTAPGNPTGRERTVWNAKAALSALLPHFAEHPDTLFVYFTAPPNAPRVHPEPLWKLAIKKVLGRRTAAESLSYSGQLARQVNDWVVSPDGWLSDYPHNNVVVFDYYNILTGDGASNLLAYPSGDGGDPHPSLEGQRRAAAAFVPFINRAVRYAGLVPTDPHAAVEPSDDRTFAADASGDSKP